MRCTDPFPSLGLESLFLRCKEQLRATVWYGGWGCARIQLHNEPDNSRGILVLSFLTAVPISKMELKRLEVDEGQVFTAVPGPQ